MKTWELLCEILGDSLALRVVQELGGRRFYISKKFKEEHNPFVPIIGADKAKELSLALSGIRLDIPVLDAHSRSARNSQILSDYNAGEKIGNLAKKYRMTERSIKLIINKPILQKKVAEPRQPPPAEICADHDEDDWYLKRLKVQKYLRENR